MLTSENLPLAEYFSAGEILADELEARGWSQFEFAEMIGFPTQFVSDLIDGKQDLTSDSASRLEAALGIQAATWLGLQADYRLWEKQ